MIFSLCFIFFLPSYFCVYVYINMSKLESLWRILSWWVIEFDFHFQKITWVTVLRTDYKIRWKQPGRRQERWLGLHLGREVDWFQIYFSSEMDRMCWFVGWEEYCYKFSGWTTGLIWKRNRSWGDDQEVFFWSRQCDIF